jgi:FdrA protein
VVPASATARRSWAPRERTGGAAAGAVDALGARLAAPPHPARWPAGCARDGPLGGRCAPGRTGRRRDALLGLGPGAHPPARDDVLAGALVTSAHLGPGLPALVAHVHTARGRDDGAVRDLLRQPGAGRAADAPVCATCVDALVGDRPVGACRRRTARRRPRPPGTTPPAGGLLAALGRASTGRGSPVTDHVEVRRGTYHDSVTLMQVTRRCGSSPGVDAALVAMATELNLELPAGLDLPAPDGAGPNDLLVGVRADDEAALTTALAALDTALQASTARPSGGTSGPEAARTTASAAGRVPATLAVVSVPGPYAFLEAMDALRSGCRWSSFSDNVPVEQEVRLKDEAASRDLLVMGPDCGTAAVGGVGIGFANLVRPGRVGLVAASGTGAQQLMCLLDEAGVGLSACLGVGGATCLGPSAGRSTRQALAALDADPGTDLVVLVSKPPAPEVAAEVRALAEGLSTPVVLALLGEGAADLHRVVEQVVGTLGGGPGLADLGAGRGPPTPARRPARPVLRGHALRRGHGHRRGRARPGRSNIPLGRSGRCRPTSRRTATRCSTSATTGSPPDARTR